MNKTELIETVAARLTADHKSTAAVLDVVLDEISRALVKGDRVALTGFGTFEKRARPARTARNPRTGETIKLKKTSVPAFKAGATLKSVVSGATKLPKVAPAKKASSAKASAAKKTAAKAPAKTAAVTRAAVTKATVATKAPAKKLATKAAAKKAAPVKKAAAKKAPAKKTTARR